MRYFEILIPASLLYMLVVLFFVKKGRRTLISSTTIITAIVILCHLLIEGSRWQMFPAYVFTIILFSICLFSLRLKGPKKPGPASMTGRLLRASGIFLTFLLLLLVLVPPALLPVFQIPEPTGSFDVGTSTLFFSDSSRLDLHAEEMNSYRELSVRIWYPATLDGHEKSLPYMNAQEARALGELYYMPSFLLGHFTRVKTNSYLNAAPLEGSYPLVFYSPSGDMVQNTALFQELASHGYVVFSVGHPYWNAFTYDAKGEVIPFDNENAYYSAMWDEEYSDSVNAIKEKITAASDLEEKRIAHKRLNQHMPLEIADIRLWAEDLSFLLDELKDPADDLGEFVNHLDTRRVGVMGFSKGGSAAGQFCVSDSRCMAGVNLSGFMFGDAVNQGIDVPFMFLENMEEWCQDCNPVSGVLYEDALGDAFMVRIKESRHGNFSDWSLVGGYLKGIDHALLNGPDSKYPEVVFESRINQASE